MMSPHPGRHTAPFILENLFAWADVIPPNRSPRSRQGQIFHDIPDQESFISFFLLRVFISLVTLIGITVTIGDLIVARNNYQKNAELLRNETAGSITESVRIFDDGLKLFDNTLNRRMAEAFVVYWDRV